jgi:hypothetical protein
MHKRRDSQAPVRIARMLRDLAGPIWGVQKEECRRRLSPPRCPAKRRLIAASAANTSRPPRDTTRKSDTRGRRAKRTAQHSRYSNHKACSKPRHNKACRMLCRTRRLHRPRGSRAEMYQPSAGNE